eukprot:m.286399 g.286399  ORF g.286399 m.286399 type:complete len:62 (+) comp16208_c0_seq3:724-909(+)
MAPLSKAMVQEPYSKISILLQPWSHNGQFEVVDCPYPLFASLFGLVTPPVLGGIFNTAHFY